jgi:hypothetical protein
MRRIVIPTALGLLLAVLLAACGGGDSRGGDQAGTPAARGERARAIAQNMLLAYNSGDYQAFSRDWSSPVKLVVGERAFRELRDHNLPITGPFKTLTSVTPSVGQQDADHASYEVLAQFEKQDGVLFTMTLSTGGAKVEGLEFKPQP